MSQSIRTRLTFTFLMLAGLPLLLATLASVTLLYRYSLDITFSHMHESASRVATQIDRELERYEYELRSVLRYREFMQLDQSEQFQLLDELIASNDFFIQGMLIGPDGQEQVRISSRKIVTPEQLRDRSQEPRFQQPASTLTVYYSEVFIDPVRGEPVMSISIPLLDLRSGKVAGVLSVDTRLTNIWNLIAGLEFEPSSDIYLLNSHGRLIAHRNPSLVLRETHFSYRYAAILQPGLSGTQVVLAAAPVTPVPQQFLVVAELAGLAALRPAWEMLTVFAIVVLAALLAASLLVVISRHLVLDRLYRVVEAARAIAGGDLHRRVEVDRVDELGVLAESFNAMAEHLVLSLEQTHLSEELFRQLAESVPQVVWLSDWAGDSPSAWQRHRLRYVSPLFEQVWGQSLEALYRDPELWTMAIHPEDRKRVQQLFREQVASGGYVCDYRIVRPDRSLRYIREQAIPIHNAAGEVYRIAGLAQDVTELRDNERHLTRLNRALQTLSACNEVLVRADDKTQLLKEVCRNLVNLGGYRYAAIRYLQPDGSVTGNTIEQN